MKALRIVIVGLAVAVSISGCTIAHKVGADLDPVLPGAATVADKSAQIGNRTCGAVGTVCAVVPNAVGAFSGTPAIGNAMSGASAILNTLCHAVIDTCTAAIGNAG